MKNWLWISWESHRRTKELSKEFAIKLIEKEIHAPRIIKHPYLIFWTFYIIFWLKPKGLIVQNPSLLLALEAVVLKKLFGYSLIVDSHNGGLYPIYPKILKLFSLVFKYVQKWANLTIVTNSNLAAIVEGNNGNSFVLEDKVPEIQGGKIEQLKGRFNIVCISTFAEDEPYAEVIEAAKNIHADWFIYMTGNPKGILEKFYNKIPHNLVLTGFLSEENYVSLLKSADVIMDLTFLEDCLVCGAYEAIAVEKPLILNSQNAIIKYFTMGAVYTENNSKDISISINKAFENHVALKREVKILKRKLNIDWSLKRERLEKILNSVEFGQS